MLKAGLLLVGLALVAALGGPFITPFDPVRQELALRLAPPSMSHWFGLDELGLVLRRGCTVMAGFDQHEPRIRRQFERDRRNAGNRHYCRTWLGFWRSRTRRVVIADGRAAGGGGHQVAGGSDEGHKLLGRAKVKAAMAYPAAPRDPASHRRWRHLVAWFPPALLPAQPGLS